jgi:hypothetical protein
MRVAENAKLEWRDPPNYDGGKRHTLSKNSPKNTSENSAANKGMDGSGNAAALVEELVSHGVSRAVARRLSREKPEVCRKCLEYLPYAIIRKTKGAWLANAVRDEYGPPVGFVKARYQRKLEEEAARRGEARKRRQGRKDALSREKESQLRETLVQIEREQEEAFAAFTGYVLEQREKVVKMAANLAVAARQRYPGPGVFAGTRQPSLNLTMLGMRRMTVPSAPSLKVVLWTGP